MREADRIVTIRPAMPPPQDDRPPPATAAAPGPGCDPEGKQAGAAAVPLCVDVDGTLLRTNTLHEQLVALLGRSPWAPYRLLPAVRGGRAAFKRAVAEASPLDVDGLPLRDSVLELIARARAEGQPVWLATGADRGVGEGVARHLREASGVGFDRILASEPGRNTTGATKVAAIRDAADGGAFDYVGDSAADLPVLEAARRGWIVSPSARLRARVARIGGAVAVLGEPAASLADWLEACSARAALIAGLPLLVLLPVARGVLPLLALVGAVVLAEAASRLFERALGVGEARRRAEAGALARGRIPLAHAGALCAALAAVALALGGSVAALSALALAGRIALGAARVWASSEAGRRLLGVAAHAASLLAALPALAL